MDPAAAVQDITVSKIGKKLFTKAKINQARVDNIMVDKHMNEETERLNRTCEKCILLN